LLRVRIKYVYVHARTREQIYLGNTMRAVLWSIPFP